MKHARIFCCLLGAGIAREGEGLAEGWPPPCHVTQ